MRSVGHLHIGFFLKSNGKIVGRRIIPRIRKKVILKKKKQRHLTFSMPQLRGREASDLHPRKKKKQRRIFGFRIILQSICCGRRGIAWSTAETFGARIDHANGHPGPIDVPLDLMYHPNCRLPTSRCYKIPTH